MGIGRAKEDEDLEEEVCTKGIVLVGDRKIRRIHWKHTLLMFINAY